MNFTLPTYQDIIQFIFYNETNKIVQKNVLILTQISSLYVVFIVYQLIAVGLSAFRVHDALIIIILFSTWYAVKKHGIYYTRLLFIVLVPMFNLAIIDTIYANGTIGTLWIFPIISTLYFFFHKKTALIAVFITFIVTIFACTSFMPIRNIFRVIITVLIVIFSFSSVFFNFYRQYEMLEDKVKKDSLTKLLNRSVLEELLLASTDKLEKKLYPVILCFDLDNFKYVNDTFGHSVGDTVLINTATVFTNEVKKTDSVFRLGGEEFLILLTDISLQDASMLAEQIRQTLETTDLIGNGHTVTSSIGVALYRPDEEWNQWLKRADDAMYHAKKSGKNKVVVAD